MGILSKSVTFGKTIFYGGIATVVGLAVLEGTGNDEAADKFRKGLAEATASADKNTSKIVDGVGDRISNALHDGMSALRGSRREAEAAWLEAGQDRMEVAGVKFNYDPGTGTFTFHQLDDDTLRPLTINGYGAASMIETMLDGDLDKPATLASYEYKHNPVVSTPDLMIWKVKIARITYTLKAEIEKNPLTGDISYEGGLHFAEDLSVPRRKL